MMDLVSAAFQVARAMEFLVSRKVRIFLFHVIVLLLVVLMTFITKMCQSFVISTEVVVIWEERGGGVKSPPA